MNGSRLRYAIALGCAIGGVARVAHAQEFGSALYIRTDTDHTLVVAPRVRAQAPVTDATRVSFVYAADIWTSASIDIMSSASKLPVNEQRDEIDVSLDQDIEDLKLTAAYRYSTEPDYVSHGASGGFSYDFADHNSTLALGLSASADSVGKAGDPTFSRSLGTLGARLIFTQVLGRGTLAQATYDLSRANGYQVSPYRYVPIGGDGMCTSSADQPAAQLSSICVPEAGPNERLRHALALELRQALGERWSLGAAYRFYTDDWGLVSNTLRAELTVQPDEAWLLAARYRFYTQGAAKQYRANYVQMERYVTRDKELSPLSSHRIALELERSFSFRDHRKLTTTLSFAPIFYSYRDFALLDHINAYEITAAVVFVP